MVCQLQKPAKHSPMRLDDFPGRDGKRVWLDQSELDLLIDKSKTAEQEIAFRLAGRAGLRREEVISVTFNDFKHAPDGFLRVWGDYAKRDHYRETPIPDDLQGIVGNRSYEREPDEAVVDATGQTVYRWVKRAAEECWAETDDPGWQFLTPHDLRRTWGGHLLWDCGVLPAVVMSWGGWDDWGTFKDHYLGEMSPAAAERERSKIFEQADADGPVFEPTVNTKSNYSRA